MQDTVLRLDLGKALACGDRTLDLAYEMQTELRESPEMDELERR